MTMITFDSAPRRISSGSKRNGFFAMIARALDAYATYRTQKAVPEAELRRADRTIKRYQRLLDKASEQSRRHNTMRTAKSH